MKLSEFNRQVANLSEQHGDRELYVNGEPWSGTIDVLNNPDFVNITIDAGGGSSGANQGQAAAAPSAT